MGKARYSVWICVPAVVLVLVSSAAFARHATVVGTVYSSYEIVTDSGEVYEVVADEKGAELAGYDGAVVRVTGVIEEEEGDRFLQVVTYTLLEEQAPYEHEAPAGENLEEGPAEDGPAPEAGYLPEEDGYYGEDLEEQEGY